MSPIYKTDAMDHVTVWNALHSYCIINVTTRGGVYTLKSSPDPPNSQWRHWGREGWHPSEGNKSDSDEQKNRQFFREK